MSDEANDNLNMLSPDVVRATLKKLGKKKSNNSETVAPIAEPKFSDPKSRFLDELYKQHWTDLCGWLYRRYGSGPPEPEDIAQTAFESMVAMDDLTKIKNPRAYLFSTAVYAAIKGLKWMAKTRHLIDNELRHRNQSVEEISPERLYSVRERFSIVTQTINNLSEKQREIVTRSRLHGQTYEQITAETGWSKADISRQLKMAMEILREALASDQREGN